jgi:DNA-binding transcriptional ArsR family regulator
MNRSRVSQQVLDCVCDLVRADQPAHRTNIASILGLKLSVVDDHLKRMKNEGVIKLIERGRYVPVPQARPDRSVSHTITPDFLIKLEVGDEVLDLSLREARMVALVIGGVALAFGQSVPQA